LKNARTLIIGMIAGAVLATAGSAYAASAIEKVTAMIRPDYKVVVDGKQVQLKNAPISYNGTTYIPLREAGEMFGRTVGFKDGTITLDQQQPAQTGGKDDAGVSTVTQTPGSQADEINMDEWVSINSLTSSGLTWSIGLPDGATSNTHEREYRLIYNDKVESFIIPEAVVTPYICRNNNGVELLFDTGGPFIKKTFAEQFLS
jgi:hypothetical protein